MSAASTGRERRVCGMHQPHYLPWLRYFDKIAKSDVFVVLDDLQYSRNGWQNRNRVKGPQGSFLLTVPVRHRYASALGEVRIPEDRWRRAHLEALRTSYGKAPGFELFFPPVERLLSRPWTSLVDLNLALLEVLLDLLGARTAIRRSSTLHVPGAATERLANLCQAVGATHYLTGAYAVEAYLEVDALRARGLGVLYHDWKAPVYPQAHPRAGFIPDLSIVDLLAARGGDAMTVLEQGGTTVECA